MRNFPYSIYCLRENLSKTHINGIFFLLVNLTYSSRSDWSFNAHIISWYILGSIFKLVCQWLSDIWSHPGQYQVHLPTPPCSPKGHSHVYQSLSHPVCHMSISTSISEIRPFKKISLKIQAKVMVVVKLWGNIVYPASNQFPSFSFHINQITQSSDTAISKFDLGNQGEGHGWRQSLRSHSRPIHAFPLCFTSIPKYSYLEIQPWKSESQDHNWVQRSRPHSWTRIQSI